MFSLRRRSRHRKGVEILEFAMMLPLFFSIVMGIIEFGRGFEVAQWLTASAREGARLAMLYNVISQKDKDKGITSGNQKIETDIKNFLAAASITEGVQVHIFPQGAAPSGSGSYPPFNIDDYSSNAGKYFTVRVTVPFAEVALIDPIFMTDTLLSGEITVRHE